MATSYYGPHGVVMGLQSYYSWDCSPTNRVFGGRSLPIYMWVRAGAHVYAYVRVRIMRVRVHVRTRKRVRTCAHVGARARACGCAQPCAHCG